MNNKTIFYGRISGEREVLVSSIDPDLSVSPADDAAYSACVSAHNAVIDLIQKHLNTHRRYTPKYKDVKVDVDMVDIHDEEQFLEFDGDFLFPTSGLVEYVFDIREKEVPSFVSTLPTSLHLDGGTISIDWLPPLKV